MHIFTPAIYMCVHVYICIHTHLSFTLNILNRFVKDEGKILINCDYVKAASYNLIQRI